MIVIPKLFNSQKRMPPMMIFLMIFLAKYEKEEGKRKNYVKNDLICDLTELEGNKWQVKISVKGYHDKGFFEKLIFGNTKPKGNGSDFL